MAEPVAEFVVGVLEQIGVKAILGLIGESLNPLADAVRRSKIEWIGVRHEEGGALAAAGQAKLTGQLAVCAGTTGPGSTHLVAGLYEASRDHAPVLARSGDMPRKIAWHRKLFGVKSDCGAEIIWRALTVGTAGLCVGDAHT